jgi:UDPglucose--hexose-1-phosphate uridylyltransferase
MSELRLNVLTNEWVIVAPERVGRPTDFVRARERPPAAPFDARCPFCPGNEAECTTELFRSTLSGASSWQTRVFRNKFPALSLDHGDPSPRRDGLHVSVDGFGVHEVVVETPRHDMTAALLRVEEVEAILRTYRARYRACRAEDWIAHTVIFKNHGPNAGTSLIHPHSQIVSTPVVSNQVQSRLKVMGDYLTAHGECIGCRLVDEELQAGARVVRVSETFVAMVPYAALSSFHIWVFPRRHAASFGEVSDAELADLAHMLRAVLQRLYHGLHDPDFNYVIRSAPRGVRREQFHWYMSVVPRVGQVAGFELGSGVYINVTRPEDSAEFLRSVRVPEEAAPSSRPHRTAVGG